MPCDVFLERRLRRQINDYPRRIWQDYSNNGVEIPILNKDIMNACFKAAHEVYEEESEKNPKFKKVYEAWKVFRDDQILWFRVAEQNFDNYMATAGSASKAAPEKK